MRIHGLPLDFQTRAENGHISAWNTAVTEYGVTRFPDGCWMVTLPGGTGFGGTVSVAIEYAKADQHERLWGAP